MRKASALEGVVGKGSSSLRRTRQRLGAWIKHRTNREQEFVIGGCIPGSARVSRCVLLVGALRKNNERARLRREGSDKDDVPRNRDEIITKSQPLPSWIAQFVDNCRFTAEMALRKGAIVRLRVIMRRAQTRARPAELTIERLKVR